MKEVTAYEVEGRVYATKHEAMLMRAATDFAYALEPDMFREGETVGGKASDTIAALTAARDVGLIMAKANIEKLEALTAKIKDE